MRKQSLRPRVFVRLSGVCVCVGFCDQQRTFGVCSRRICFLFQLPSACFVLAASHVELLSPKNVDGHLSLLFHSSSSLSCVPNPGRRLAVHSIFFLCFFVLALPPVS